MTEDEMVGWHRRRDGYEFEQTPGDSEAQGTCCGAVRGVAHDLVTEQQTSAWGFPRVGQA